MPADWQILRLDVGTVPDRASWRKGLGRSPRVHVAPRDYIEDRQDCGPVGLGSWTG